MTTGSRPAWQLVMALQEERSQSTGVTSSILSSAIFHSGLVWISTILPVTRNSTRSQILVTRSAIRSRL